MIIELVRHAQSIANSEGTIQGQIDSMLSMEGIKQAKSLGSKLRKDYDVVYCSPLARARTTALLCLTEIEYDLSKVQYDDRLREINLGSLEGKPRAEYLQDGSILNKLRSLDPTLENFYDGESTQEFTVRTIAMFEYIVAEMSENSYKNSLIISHGGVLHSILGLHLNLRAAPYQNTEMVAIKWKGSKWCLIENGV